MTAFRLYFSARGKSRFIFKIAADSGQGHAHQLRRHKCTAKINFYIIQHFRSINPHKLKIKLNLYTILQIFSVTIFEKGAILQLLTDYEYNNELTDSCNQLELFDL
jgi:hypothetical protein